MKFIIGIEIYVDVICRRIRKLILKELVEYVCFSLSVVANGAVMTYDLRNSV